MLCFLTSPLRLHTAVQRGRYHNNHFLSPGTGCSHLFHTQKILIYCLPQMPCCLSLISSSLDSEEHSSHLINDDLWGWHETYCYSGLAKVFIVWRESTEQDSSMLKPPSLTPSQSPSDGHLRRQNSHSLLLLPQHDVIEHQQNILLSYSSLLSQLSSHCTCLLSDYTL